MMTHGSCDNNDKDNTNSNDNNTYNDENKAENNSNNDENYGAQSSRRLKVQILAITWSSTLLFKLKIDPTLSTFVNCFASLYALISYQSCSCKLRWCLWERYFSCFRNSQDILAECITSLLVTSQPRANPNHLYSLSETCPCSWYKLYSSLNVLLQSLYSSTLMCQWHDDSIPYIWRQVIVLASNIPHSLNPSILWCSLATFNIIWGRVGKKLKSVAFFQTQIHPTSMFSYWMVNPCDHDLTFWIWIGCYLLLYWLQQTKYFTKICRLFFCWFCCRIFVGNDFVRHLQSQSMFLDYCLQLSCITTKPGGSSQIIGNGFTFFPMIPHLLHRFNIWN